MQNAEMLSETKVSLLLINKYIYMKLVIQRVKSAILCVNSIEIASISNGMLTYIGVSNADTSQKYQWLAKKLANLRIFDDENGDLNHSLIDTLGEIMFVSNFTLYGDAKKGFRPSYTDSASREIAEPIYKNFVEYFRNAYPNINVAEGVFGADMQITSIADGPVNIIIER
jgi:D-tyrosyl-tRNA(Tyr) deacylase